MTPERGTAGVSNLKTARSLAIKVPGGMSARAASKARFTVMGCRRMPPYASVRSMLLPYAAPSIKTRLDYIVCSRQRRYRIHLGGSYGSTGAPP
jgi:hypothetical protein